MQDEEEQSVDNPQVERRVRVEIGMLPSAAFEQRISKLQMGREKKQMRRTDSFCQAKFESPQLT